MVPDVYPELADLNLNKLEEKDLIPLLLLIEKRKGQIIEGLPEPLEPRTQKINLGEVEEQSKP